MKGDGRHQRAPFEVRARRPENEPGQMPGKLRAVLVLQPVNRLGERAPVEKRGVRALEWRGLAAAVATELHLGLAAKPTPGR